jgi:Arc/MetJ-type ribon-helix-helix transcriptional regulator
MTTPKRKNTTIRFNDEERDEFESKMREFGYKEMSPFIRFAIRQLRRAK